MKFTTYINSFLILSAITLFSQCSSGIADSAEIASLKMKKDSLIEVKKEVSEQINTIEGQVRLLDTANRRNVPVVTIEKANTTIFKHYFEVQGIVETDQNATIHAETSGKIERISVAEGDRVKKGQLLMKLDDGVILNNIEEVRTQIELATTMYEKQKKLWNQKIGSEIQFLEAKSNKESLEKRLQTLYSQLELYNIKAPFDGFVDEIFPKVGEMAMPGIPMIRVINLDNMYLKADVSEDYLSHVKIGDTSIIDVPAAGIKVQSKIHRIGNFINPNNRTFKIRFELNNKDSKLIPNMLAVVKVQDYVSPVNTIVIDYNLLQENPQGEKFVYVMEMNGTTRAKKAMVQAGRTYKGKVEILSGLTPESKLIVQGARGIKDGEIIEVKDNS